MGIGSNHYSIIINIINTRERLVVEANNFSFTYYLAMLEGVV